MGIGSLKNLYSESSFGEKWEKIYTDLGSRQTRELAQNRGKFRKEGKTIVHTLANVAE